VWADNRNVELDIYGFDLWRNAEIRITSTPYDESQPVLNGPWLLCMQDSLGAQTGNAELIHLPSLLAVFLTGTPILKTFPALADGAAVWQETISNQSQIVSAALPSLQPVFQNRNAVVVTLSMVSYAQDAYGLLSLWATNGVQSITEYTSLLPQVATQTASMANGVASGQDFSLVAGSFLWVQFNSTQVLDLGLNNTSPLNLAAGPNVFGFTPFPNGFSAFQLLRQLGLDNALAVRMLDACPRRKSGRGRLPDSLHGCPDGEHGQSCEPILPPIPITYAPHRFQIDLLGGRIGSLRLPGLPSASDLGGRLAERPSSGGQGHRH
jgi:hypothetical protein